MHHLPGASQQGRAHSQLALFAPGSPSDYKLKSSFFLFSNKFKTLSKFRFSTPPVPFPRFPLHEICSASCVSLCSCQFNTISSGFNLVVLFSCSSIPIASTHGFANKARVRCANSGWGQGGKKAERAIQMVQTWFDY